MAQHKSAEKRARQALKRRDRNRQVRTRLRSVIKTAREELAKGDGSSATSIQAAEVALQKAASKGVIPRKRASRQVSRLTRARNRAAAKS